MTQEPMTQDGVENKLVEVYALPTNDRLVEAGLIESGFKTWISDNFILDTDQVTFLAGMDGTAASNYGAACGLAVRHELPVYFTPTPRTKPTKWLGMNNDLVVTSNGSGGETVTGSLTFFVEWKD